MLVNLPICGFLEVAVIQKFQYFRKRVLYGAVMYKNSNSCNWRMRVTGLCSCEVFRVLEANQTTVFLANQSTRYIKPPPQSLLIARRVKPRGYCILAGNQSMWPRRLYCGFSLCTSIYSSRPLLWRFVPIPVSREICAAMKTFTLTASTSQPPIGESDATQKCG